MASKKSPAADIAAASAASADSRALVKVQKSTGGFANPEDLLIPGLDSIPDWCETADFEDPERLEGFSFSDEMLMSIALNGVRVPVCVKRFQQKISKGTTGTAKSCLVVVAGRHRTRHAREVNRQLRVKGTPEQCVQVQYYTQQDADWMDPVIENAESLRVATPPMAKARQARRLKSRGIDIPSIASAFGVSVSTIKNWGLLLSLAPEIQKAVDAGAFPVSAATALAREHKTHADQLEAWETAAAAAAGPKPRGPKPAAEGGGPRTPDPRKLLAKFRLSLESTPAKERTELHPLILATVQFLQTGDHDALADWAEAHTWAGRAVKRGPSTEEMALDTWILRELRKGTATAETLSERHPTENVIAIQEVLDTMNAEDGNVQQFPGGKWGIAAV